MKRKVVNVIKPDNDDIQKNNRSRKVIIKIISFMTAIFMYSYLLSIPVYTNNAINQDIDIDEIKALNGEDLLKYLKDKTRKVLMLAPQEYVFDELQEDNFNKLKRKRKTK